MKLGRTHGYNDNASKLHKKVGAIIKSSSLSSYTWIQEYPVVRVNSNFKSKRERFDWACPDIKLVIEVHGRQHYFETSFGKGSEKSPEVLLRETQERDRLKKTAALEMGWLYIAISYNEIDVYNSDTLWNRYVELLDEQNELIKSTKTKNTYRKPTYDKQKAKQQRKESYKKRKKWLKEQKNVQD